MPVACSNHISANDVDGQPGSITYTQWLNERGLLEADLTVTKLDEERFLVVVTDTMHRHAETWIKRHTPADAHAFVTDVTSGYCQLNVQGPKSRELLQTLTSADLSNAAFPVPHRARDRHRLCPRAVHPHHLRRRAGIRALHPDRAGRARLRPPGRGRERLRAAPRGPQGAGEPAHGEGLPRLRPRHRQHRQRLRDRPRLVRRSRRRPDSSAARPR